MNQPGDVPLENVAPYQQKPGGTGGNIFCSSRHPTDPDVWCRRFPGHEGNCWAYRFSIKVPEQWENPRS